MKYDILIAGFGLSSLSFLKSYMEENKKEKVYVIAPDFNIETNDDENNHLISKKNLPPQFLNKQKFISSYLKINDLKVDHKSYLIGSSSLHGMSTEWGYQIDKNFNNDFSPFSKKTIKKINDCYDILFSSKKKKFVNENSFFSETFNLKLKNFLIKKPNLALLQNSNNHMVDHKNKMNGENFLNFHIDKKRIVLLNYAIKKIYSEKKKNIKLLVINEKNEKKIIYTKKLVLGLGTIATTKLILDYLNITKTVKIRHHPRIIAAFLSKKKFHLTHQINPKLHICLKKKPADFVIDMRPNSKPIIQAIKNYYRSMFVAFVLRLIKKRLVFCNIFLNSKYSNLYMRKNKNSFYIYSKKNKINLKKYKKIFYKLIKFLNSFNLAFKLFKIFLPEAGSDYHYFGTFKIKEKKGLSLNEKCQLNENKNIYIIDGSSINYKNTLFPTGAIMANAMRLGYIIKK
jgi:hypothetical protein